MTVIVGRYLLLFISLAGLALSVGDRFSEEDIDKFLDYIFRLHNVVRTKHHVPKLFRTYEMDVIAHQKHKEIKADRLDKIDELGVVVFWNIYNDSTQLDVEEAKNVFAVNYEQGNFYDYVVAPIGRSAVDFTQIVWRETTQIGLMFSCGKTSYVVLAVYYPYGNIEEEYLSNVQRPINTKAVTDSDIGLIYRTEKEKFMDNMLFLHNDTRANHGVGPLIHNNEMDELADSIIRGRRDITYDYGMNFLNHNIPYGKLGDIASAKEVFSKWYEKEQFYNYEVGRQLTINNTDSFTQIVWKGTKQIGIGIKSGYSNEYSFLVLYIPAGNITDRYTSNVYTLQNMDQGESSGNN